MDLAQRNRWMNIMFVTLMFTSAALIAFDIWGRAWVWLVFHCVLAVLIVAVSVLRWKVNRDLRRCGLR